MFDAPSEQCLVEEKNRKDKNAKEHKTPHLDKPHTPSPDRWGKSHASRTTVNRYSPVTMRMVMARRLCSDDGNPCHNPDEFC